MSIIHNPKIITGSERDYKTLNSSNNGNLVIEYNKSLTKFEGVVNNVIISGGGLIDLTNMIGSLPVIKEPPMSSFVLYDSINNVFKCDPNTKSYYSFQISLALSGSLNTVGGDDLYYFKITRPNGVVIRSVKYTSNNFDPINFEELELYKQSTFVFSGGLDPYQIDGFKIQVEIITGANIILNGNQDIRFFKG